MGSRVLLVDDNEDMTESGKLVLTMRGFIVETASNGLEGLVKFQHFRPDVVLLDLLMPGINGLEVARLIRREDKKCKIAILTGYLASEMRDQIACLGCAFFLKPTSIEDIEKFILDQEHRAS